MRQALNMPREGRFSARQTLRAATASLHTEVDARFGGSFETDHNAYRSFVTALARVVRPLEAALEAGGVSRILPDWPLRRRSVALERDLQILGIPVPVPVVVHVTDDEARLFGRLYVLEGSRLGSRILVKSAHANAAPSVSAATNYLEHGAGADFWEAFLVRLERSEAVAAFPERTILGAREAFGLFIASQAHV
jgi:heme oxygenase